MSLGDDDIQLPRSRAAIERLERALLRLESVAMKPGVDLFGGDELQAVRDDYARLDGTARVVEERLDAVIDRLKTILKD
jgi:hypothetical protein